MIDNQFKRKFRHFIIDTVKIENVLIWRENVCDICNVINKKRLIAKQIRKDLLLIYFFRRLS